MPHYRLYILDGGGGMMGAVEFESTNDEQAKQHAETVLGDAQCGELWRRVNSDPAAERGGHAREPS